MKKNYTQIDLKNTISNLKKNKGFIVFTPFSNYVFNSDTNYVIYSFDITGLFENDIIQNYGNVYKKYLERLLWI